MQANNNFLIDSVCNLVAERRRGESASEYQGDLGESARCVSLWVLLVTRISATRSMSRTKAIRQWAKPADFECAVYW